MSKPQKLTATMLKNIILEEKSKIEADKTKYEKDLVTLAKKTKEVDADGYASTLEKEVDFAAVLKIKEASLRSKLRKIQEARRAARKRLAKFSS